jgi:hypothetical protein
MGSTRSHPLPPGIFVKMPSPPIARSQPLSAWYTEAESISVSNEFDGWTEKDFDEEIDRLNKRLKELDEIKKEEYDSDDVMNDPDVRKMVENGEHICHMFDGECLACEMDEDGENTDLEDFEEEDDEVRVLTEEEVQNDPEMTAQVNKVDELRAHFC